jgi:hypothetical protein
LPLPAAKAKGPAAKGKPEAPAAAKPGTPTGGKKGAAAPPPDDDPFVVPEGQKAQIIRQLAPTHLVQVGAAALRACLPACLPACTPSPAGKRR